MKQKDIEKYIDRCGLHCPYCDSLDIKGGFVQIDAGSAWQEIECLDCGKLWKDIYRLVDIEEDE